jgi:recombination protein RecA
MAPPFRMAEFDIMYGEGISREGTVVDLGADKGIIQKSGAWYTFGEERLGQGRENTKQFLKEHPEMASNIELKIMKTIESESAAVEENKKKTDKLASRPEPEDIGAKTAAAPVGADDRSS